MQSSGVSKKTTVAAMAITSIAASNEVKTQIVIATVAVVSIIVQALADYLKGKRDESTDSSV